MRPSPDNSAPRSTLVQLARRSVVGLLLSAASLLPVAAACPCGTGCGCQVVTIRPAVAAVAAPSIKEAPRRVERRPLAVRVASRPLPAIVGTHPRPLHRPIPALFQRPPPVRS